jgi:hypothetical protein
MLHKGFADLACNSVVLQFIGNDEPDGKIFDAQ